MLEIIWPSDEMTLNFGASQDLSKSFGEQVDQYFNCNPSNFHAKSSIDVAIAKFQSWNYLTLLKWTK